MNFFCLPILRQEIGHELLTEWTEISDVDNVVARGLATRCLTQIAYAIGVAEPVSFGVDTGGTGDLPDEDIAAAPLAEFDLRPAAIIERLDLKTPIYYPTAAWTFWQRRVCVGGA